MLLWWGRRVHEKEKTCEKMKPFLVGVTKCGLRSLPTRTADGRDGRLRTRARSEGGGGSAMGSPRLAFFQLKTE